jgi:hypothetical protein
MRMLRTTQALPTETWSFEAFTGTYDGQGMPDYDSPVSFEANVLEYASGGPGAEFLEMPDGSKHRIPLTLYVRGDAANVPEEEDRLTRGSDAKAFICAEKKIVTGLWYERNQADHYRLALKLEGDA